MPQTLQETPAPSVPTSTPKQPRDLPHGLLTPPPVVWASIERERNGQPSKNFTRADEGLLSMWTVESVFASLGHEVLYRVTPEGPVVVAVGEQEIQAARKTLSEDEQQGLCTYQDDSALLLREKIPKEILAPHANLIATGRERSTRQPQDLPHGLLRPPAVTLAVLEHERTRHPAKDFARAEQRLMNQWTLDFFFEFQPYEVLYRATPDGPEVLAIGFDEISAATNHFDPQAMRGLDNWMP